MNDYIETIQFRKRNQQRCVCRSVATVLLYYGEVKSVHSGIESMIFTKHALAEIRNDLGPVAYKACEKLKNTYIIVSENGVLITVARSYRKTVH